MSEVDLVERAGMLAEFLTCQCFHLQSGPLEQNPECCAARRYAFTAIQLAEEVERLRKRKCKTCGENLEVGEIGRRLGFRPDILALKLGQAEKENTRLAEELADIQNSQRIILAEDCPTDEVHCGCVPTLRDELESTRMQLISFKEALREADDVAERLRGALGKIRDDHLELAGEEQDIARAALSSTEPAEEKPNEPT